MISIALSLLLLSSPLAMRSTMQQDSTMQQERKRAAQEPKHLSKNEVRVMQDPSPPKASQGDKSSPKVKKTEVVVVFHVLGMRKARSGAT
jgi:hypothetical protein